MDIAIGLAALVVIVITARRRRRWRPVADPEALRRDQRRFAFMPVVLGVALVGLIAVMSLLYR